MSLKVPPLGFPKALVLVYVIQSLCAMLLHAVVTLCVDFSLEENITEVVGSISVDSTTMLSYACYYRYYNNCMLFVNTSTALYMALTVLSTL